VVRKSLTAGLPLDMGLEPYVRAVLSSDGRAPRSCRVRYSVVLLPVWSKSACARQ
jgi:hypothetical protein